MPTANLCRMHYTLQSVSESQIQYVQVLETVMRRARKTRRGHLRPAYQITTRSAWLGGVRISPAAYEAGR
jgi:hypothetical protein